MFIFDKYNTPFIFKNKILFKNGFYKFLQKDKSLSIHNSLFIITFSLLFYFFTPILYKNNFYNILYIKSHELLFIKTKSNIIHQ